MNPVRSVDEFEMGISSLEATESVSTTDGCKAARIPSGEKAFHVPCPLVHENVWSRALGLDPYTGGALTLEVVSGEITTAYLSFARMSFKNDAIAAFDSWRAETHPGDPDRMYLYPRLPAELRVDRSLGAAHSGVRQRPSRSGVIAPRQASQFRPQPRRRTQRWDHATQNPADTGTGSGASSL